MDNKLIYTQPISGNYILHLLDGQPKKPIIRYQYYLEVFGNTLARPKAPGDNYNNANKVDWYTELLGAPGIITEDFKKEKIEEFKDKKKTIIDELKEKPIDNGQKITLLEAFTFPPDPENYKIIDGHLVMVNWGIIKKDFKSYDPSAYDVDQINDESLEHVFGQEAEEDIKDDDEEEAEVEESEIEDEDRFNGETWESEEGYAAKNDKGHIQYFPTKQEATDWVNKQDRNLWYVVAIVIAVIILLILFRSCDNNIADNDPKGRKTINSAEGKIKKTRTNNTVAKPNDTSTPSMATTRNKKNGVKKSEPGSNSKPNKGNNTEPENNNVAKPNDTSTPSMATTRNKKNGVKKSEPGSNYKPNKKNSKRLRQKSDPDPSPDPPFMSKSDVMSRFKGKLIIPYEETNETPSEKNRLIKIGEVWEDQSKDPAELFIKDNNNKYFLLPSDNIRNSNSKYKGSSI